MRTLSNGPSKMQTTTNLGEGSVSKLSAAQAWGSEFRSQDLQKKLGSVHTCNLAQGRMEQEDSWSSLGGKSSQIGCAPSSERETLSQKVRWRVMKEDTVASIHIQEHEQLPTYILHIYYICIYVYILYTHIYVHHCLHNLPQILEVETA